MYCFLPLSYYIISVVQLNPPSLSTKRLEKYRTKSIWLKVVFMEVLSLAGPHFGNPI